MAHIPPRLFVACLLPALAASTVRADEADVFNLRASVNALRDDNLFRQSGSQKPRSETITTTVAGVDVHKRVSLQEFIGQVNWVDTRYATNDYLNAGALQYNGRWLWALESHLKGELSADRASAQNSFADFQGLRERNLRTVENQRFSAEYAFHPSWAVIGGVNHIAMSNDKPLLAETDFEATGASLGIKHTPSSGNWLSFQTRQSDGRYTKRQFSTVNQFDNGFTDRGQEFAMAWQPTGHSSFTGRLEYFQRRHDHFASRDFSGWTGQLGYQYQASAKTQLNATYQHGLNAFQDVVNINSSYYVSDDLIFAARWDATEKISLGGRLGLSHRSYRGEIIPLAGPRREDDIRRAGIDVTYKPERWLELKAGLAAEKRDTTGAALDYTDRQALLSATARF
ncbi:MAG TPA: XrtB/PEP-CTERM-associated polysaccharide biosynthesis outer membrane protein EpsL [Rhodocyclaceae bacterium]|nr:XrtB/PEP-CTERM-associated polysaccharide biosynthesis outer membrane protein EpsL [Rhodocyclaceae bacterium]